MASLGPVAEFQEALEYAEDFFLVGFDLLGREQLTHLVLAGGIADLGRAAAHQNDRLVTGLLQPAKRHDLHQAADMQAWSRAIKADIGSNALLLQQRVQARLIGGLMKLAARFHELAGNRSGIRSLVLSDAAHEGAAWVA